MPPVAGYIHTRMMLERIQCTPAPVSSEATQADRHRRGVQGGAQGEDAAPRAKSRKEQILEARAEVRFEEAVREAEEAVQAKVNERYIFVVSCV